MNQISPLTAADLAAALQIERACHACPWSEQTFASNQSAHYLNVKLTVAEKMVGFAITQLLLGEATLFNLAIHPEYQRQGYGYLLLQHLTTQLKQRAALTLWLEVRASNSGAIALYERAGFNQVSRRTDYYPGINSGINNGREDAIIMALSLA